MDTAEHIRQGFTLPDFMLDNYLKDLSDADLLVRPQTGANHWNWQLGHLITSEAFHIGSLELGSMPAIDAELQERYQPSGSASDDPADFATRDQLLAMMRTQRDATLHLLASLSDEQLAAPAPEALQYFGPTVSAVFIGEITHWMLHLGQLTLIRKQLGKPTF